MPGYGFQLANEKAATGEELAPFLLGKPLRFVRLGVKRRSFDIHRVNQLPPVFVVYSSTFSVEVVAEGESQGWGSLTLQSVLIPRSRKNTALLDFHLIFLPPPPERHYLYLKTTKSP